MDPTPAELAAISTIPHAVAWIGMQQPVLDALLEAMGGLDLLREIVLIPTAAWDEAVAAVRILVPGVGDAPPADRAPRARELGQIASLRRVARLRLGLPPEEAGGAVAVFSTETAGASQTPPVGGGSSTDVGARGHVGLRGGE